MPPSTQKMIRSAKALLDMIFFMELDVGVHLGDHLRANGIVKILAGILAAQQDDPVQNGPVHSMLGFLNVFQKFIGGVPDGLHFAARFPLSEMATVQCISLGKTGRNLNLQ